MRWTLHEETDRHKTFSNQRLTYEFITLPYFY